MQATAHGFSLLKLFPAETSGGVEHLRALAAPFPNVRFMPTGGVDGSNASEYLALPNTLCVGGSWLVPRDLVRNCDWQVLELHVARSLSKLGAAVGDS